jgi:integrase
MLDSIVVHGTILSPFLSHRIESISHMRKENPRRGKDFRDVRIDSATIQALKEHLGNRTAGRIFQTRNGTPLETHNVVRQVLKPICKRLGIAPGGMHAFRHGRVSHLQQNGVPADFTKSQVRHSSLRTASEYTHFSEQFVRDTVEKMAESPSWTHSTRLGSVEVVAN